MSSQVLKSVTDLLPQNLDTTDSPTFTGLTLTGLVDGQIVFPDSGGVLSGSSNLIWDNSNNYLGVGVTPSLAKLDIYNADSDVSTPASSIKTRTSYTATGANPDITNCDFSTTINGVVTGTTYNDVINFKNRVTVNAISGATTVSSLVGNFSFFSYGQTDTFNLTDAIAFEAGGFHLEAGFALGVISLVDYKYFSVSSSSKYNQTNAVPATETGLYIEEVKQGTTKYGIFINDFTTGSNNYEIWLDNDAEIFFRDTAIHVGSLDDGHLDLTSDTSVDINSPLLNTSAITASGVITGSNFISSVAIGTQPYACTSTTLNTNLNTDLLDSQEGTYYLDSANFTGTDWTDLTDSGDTILHGHDHNTLTNYVANEHIDHISVTLTAGVGLSGGGDISANRTFTVDLNELTTETSIASGDFIAMVDITDSGSGKITFSNFEGTLSHDNLVSGTIASHDTTATGAELNTLTDGSSTSLHTHSGSAITGFTNHRAILSNGSGALVDQAAGDITFDLAAGGGEGLNIATDGHANALNIDGSTGFIGLSTTGITHSMTIGTNSSLSTEGIVLATGTYATTGAVSGVEINLVYTPSGSATNTLIGVGGFPYYGGTSNWAGGSTIFGIYFIPVPVDASNGSSNLNIWGIRTAGSAIIIGSDVIANNVIGFEVNALKNFGPASVVTLSGNAYSIYVPAISSGSLGAGSTVAGDIAGIWVDNQIESVTSKGYAIVLNGDDDDLGGSAIWFGDGQDCSIGYHSSDYLSIDLTKNSTGTGLNVATDSEANAFNINGTNRNTTINGTSVSANYDLLLDGDGILAFKETTTPTADTNYGKIYTKTDNNLYFQDGAGEEHIVHGFPTYKSFNVTTQGLGANPDIYAAGYIQFSATDSNLSDSNLTQTFGTANVAYGAHAFIVAGGVGTTDGSDLVLTVTGVSVDDEGNRNGTDSEVIVADCTAASLNQWFETSKKWVGIITFTLSSTGGTTFTFNFNYGIAKYEDFNNNDFQVIGVEAVGFAGANDNSFNVQVLHYNSAGWVYSAAAFDPFTNNIIASLGTDYTGTNDVLASNENFAWKRSDLTTSIAGSSSEGVIIKVDSSANNAVEYCNIHLAVEF